MHLLFILTSITRWDFHPEKKKRLCLGWPRLLGQHRPADLLSMEGILMAKPTGDPFSSKYLSPLRIQLCIIPVLQIALALTLIKNKMKQQQKNHQPKQQTTNG